MLNARPAGLYEHRLVAARRALPVSGPLTVIGAVAVPATFVATASTYRPGGRLIVVPGLGHGQRLLQRLERGAALVPLLVSAPVGATKYTAPAACAGVPSPTVASTATTVNATRAANRRAPTGGL